MEINMKRCMSLLFVFFMFQGVGFSMQKDAEVMYLAEMRAKKIYCNFFVNGIPIISTAGYKAMRAYTFSDRIGRVLGEGKNTISIQAMNLPTTPEDAYCEMTITAFTDNIETGKAESKEVTSIRVTYDKDGKFTVQESQNYGDSPLTNQVKVSILDKASFADQAEGLINDVLAERELHILHPYKHHSWSYKSTPMTNTPENFKKVWEKYEEFRQAMGSKDRNKLLQLEEPGTTETEMMQGSLKELYWTNSIMSAYEEAWAAEDFKMMRVDPNDYELVISADGRLFRLVKKSDVTKMNSPIRYYMFGKHNVINPNLTLINGEIVGAF